MAITKAILKCEIKETKADHRKFPVFATTNKFGDIIKVKFQQVVKNTPQNAGTYDMYFESTLANMSKDFYGKVLWIADPNFKFQPVVSKDTVKDEFEELDPNEELPF